MVLLSLISMAVSFYEIEKFSEGAGVIGSGYFSLAGHKNILSSLFYLLIPFSVLGCIVFKGYWRVLSFVAISLSLLLIFVLNTRSVQVALILAICTFLVITLGSKLKIGLKKLTVILFFSSVIIAGVLLFRQAINSNPSEATKTTASLYERFQLWNNTFMLIEENPILGVGAGNWQYNFNKFSVKNIESASYYNTTFRRPHNDFLHVFAETGIVGFALFIFLIIWVGYAAVKKLILEKNIIVLVVFCTLTGLLVDMFFSFPKERVSHLLIVALLLAILIPLTSLQSKNLCTKSNVFVYLLLPILGFNIYLGWDRISGEHYTLKCIEAQNNLKANEAILYGLEAKSFFYSADPSGTPIDTYIGWGYKAMGNFDSLLLTAESAYLLSPFDYKVLTNYGYILGRLGQNHTAKIVLLEAIRINPNYEPTLVNLSVLEYNSGNYISAAHWLMRIEDYENKYSSNFIRIQEKLDEEID